MDDRGEKIVDLARAMLRSPTVLDAANDRHQPTKQTPLLIQKTLPLLLATAIFSAGLMHMVDTHMRKISHDEWLEIQAILSYASAETITDRAAFEGTTSENTYKSTKKDASKNAQKTAERPERPERMAAKTNTVREDIQKQILSELNLSSFEKMNADDFQKAKEQLLAKIPHTNSEK